MLVFFVMVALGLAVTVLADAALLWDGAGYMFYILHGQQPFVPNGRFGIVPLQVPLLLASGMTDDLGVLRTVFGVTHAAVPLASLLGCWLIIRQSDSRLFLWPALSVCLVTVYGQLFYVSEAMIAAVVIWPLALAGLVGMPRSSLLWMLPYAVVLLSLHPSAPLLVFATAVAALLARPWDWPFPAALVVACLFYVVLPRSAYDAGFDTGQQLAVALVRSLIGLPLLGYLAALTSGVCLVVSSKRGARLRPIFALVALAVSALLLLLEARDMQAWRNAIDFRLFAAFMVSPLILLSSVDARNRTPIPWDATTRTAIIPVLGVAFAAALGLQSWALAPLNTQLLAEMEAAPCVSAGDIPWLDLTPVNRWIVGVHSVVIQSRSPSRVILFDGRCQGDDFDTALWLRETWLGEARPEDRSAPGWFDLHQTGR